MKTFERVLSTIILVGLISMIIFAFSSCSSGYGCTGKSKYITGYKPGKHGGFTGRHQGLTRRERRR